MKAVKDESGQVLILTALALLVLLGFLALAVDVGILFVAKRNIQIAADSAAMGAAMDYLYNKSVTSAQAAGKADATKNGFTNGVNGVDVTINCPPAGIAPISDPLQITGPTPASGCSNPSTATSLAGTIPAPTGGVICYSKAVTMSNVTLGTGTYVFENGVTLGGNITSAAGGTTLDIYSGSLSVNTGTVLNLIAPTSGTYNGIAWMQPASNSSQITFQKGDSSGSLTGIIYAPSAELFFQDSGGDMSGGISFTADLIVGTLFDKTATVTITNYSQSNPTSPLKLVTLVE